MPPRAFLQQRILYKLHTVRVNLVVSASFRYWFSVRLRPFFLSFAFLIFLNKAAELCSCIGNIVGIFPLFLALFRCFFTLYFCCASHVHYCCISRIKRRTQQFAPFLWKKFCITASYCKLFSARERTLSPVCSYELPNVCIRQ